MGLGLLDGPAAIDHHEARRWCDVIFAIFNSRKLPCCRFREQIFLEWRFHKLRLNNCRAAPGGFCRGVRCRGAFLVLLSLNCTLQSLKPMQGGNALPSLQTKEKKIPAYPANRNLKNPDPTFTQLATPRGEHKSRV